MIWVHVVCTVHTMLLSMEKKLQISNSKNDVIYQQNIPWSIWKACWSQNCYQRYGEGLPHGIYYSQVCGKRFGCKKSKGDMVKNYWSSILFSKITQKQTGWARKTWSQNTYEEIHWQRLSWQVLFRNGKIRFNNVNNQKPTHLKSLTAK